MNESEQEKETMTSKDIDFIESAGSDLCESIRDLTYHIKEIRKDVDNIKEHLNLPK